MKKRHIFLKKWRIFIEEMRVNLSILVAWAICLIKVGGHIIIKEIRQVKKDWSNKRLFTAKFCKFLSILLIGAGLAEMFIYDAVIGFLIFLCSCALAAIFEHIEKGGDPWQVWNFHFFAEEMIEE